MMDQYLNWHQVCVSLSSFPLRFVIKNIIFSQCTFYIMSVNQNTEINYAVRYNTEMKGI